MTTAWLTEYRPKVGQLIAVYAATLDGALTCWYLGEDYRYLYVRPCAADEKTIRSYPLAQVAYIEWKQEDEPKQGASK